MKRSAVALVVLISLSIVSCERLQSVYDVVEAPINKDFGDITEEQVGNAIMTAAAEKGWIAHAEGVGHIVSVIYVRDHVAEVDILYSVNKYSISYNDSRNLLYNGIMIHRNYNKWIKLLDRQIKEELARI
jgi:hypothetical protein